MRLVDRLTSERLGSLHRRRRFPFSWFGTQRVPRPVGLFPSPAVFNFPCDLKTKRSFVQCYGKVEETEVCRSQPPLYLTRKWFAEKYRRPTTGTPRHLNSGRFGSPHRRRRFPFSCLVPTLRAFSIFFSLRMISISFVIKKDMELCRRRASVVAWSGFCAA